MAKQAFVADMAGKDGACVVKVKAEGGLRAAEDPETQAAIIAASDPCVKLTVAAQERNTHLQYLGALRCSLHFPGMLVQVGDLQDEKEVA
jgi:hypothetical protein